MKQSDSKALEQIPGVGKRITQDMANIGTPVRSVLSAFTPSASSPVPAFSVPAPVVTSPQMAQVTGACWVPPCGVPICTALRGVLRLKHQTQNHGY